MKQSLGFYRIEYSHGTVQSKELISQEDYNTYKELNCLKSELQTKMKGKREKDPSLVSEMKKIKDGLKEFSKPFFVVDSPLYNSIETGILSLPESQGGNHNVKITKIDDCKDLTDSDETIDSE